MCRRSVARWIAQRALSRHGSVRRLFLRALGAVYLAAFTSLRAQVLGLYGKRGIAPASEYLASMRRVLGPERYRLVPTLLWLDDSDAALVRLCRAGQLVSVGLLVGVAPRLSALVLWALYLSLVSVGAEFLSFQWDVLLLETGLLAAIGAPPGVMRWLVFRLYFESGLAKLQSGDPTWRKLEACRHYYETEPLPNRVGWYAHHLPVAAQKLSTATVLVIECAVPFLALGPRRLRRAAFWILSGLQGTFALTGNYGFFNLLSFALGLWLLDDERSRSRWTFRGLVARAATAPLVVLSVAELLARFRRGRRLLARLGRGSGWLRSLEEAAAPFHPVNPYGLFSVMTIRRCEIAIEGSSDGLTWREYRFRFKPGDITQPPRQVAPHQPRLDWQMWFAALGSPPGWFPALLTRLLEGAPEVLALLATDPFPEAPSRFVRAVFHEYRMTSLAERRRTGAWWRRERLGLYYPAVMLPAAGTDGARTLDPWQSPSPFPSPAGRGEGPHG